MLLLVGVIYVMAKITSPTVPPEVAAQNAAKAADARKAKEQARQEAIERKKMREEELDRKTEDFKRWARVHTAVTSIAVENHLSIAVTLTADKYTTEENLTAIAEEIARAYAMQVGVTYAVCHVYRGQNEVAKGRYP